jgi:hypothetical protein
MNSNFEELGDGNGDVNGSIDELVFEAETSFTIV